MKNVIFLIACLCALTACGERVSIQSGEVGKQLTTDGLENGIRKPGAFRMESCVVSACPKLIRLEVTKSTHDLTINSLFLPKSNVDIDNVQIGIQFRVKPDKESVNRVFAEVRPVKVEGSGVEYIISSQMVYDTFLKRKAPDAVITALREYRVEDVLTQVPEIAEYAKGKVNEMLGDEPIEVTELGFPNGIGEVPDEVIMAKRRLFAIEEEKARQVKALEAELAIEDQRQAVQRKRAKNDEEIAKSLDMKVEEFMKLKILERFADAAGEGTPVAIGGGFVPMNRKGR